MSVQVTLTLPDTVYKRAKHLAQLHQKNVNEVLADALNKALRSDEVRNEVIDWTEPDEAVDQETAAYLILHPSLKETHLGKHVAIYKEALVDFDDDGVALSQRVYQKYPNEFVLIKQVETEAFKVIKLRSPRLVKSHK